jgi:hypothetical protein
MHATIRTCPPESYNPGRGLPARLVTGAALPGSPLALPSLRPSVQDSHLADVRTADGVSVVAVVFLGGGMDGLEMDIPLMVAEFRFAKYDDKPVAELEQEMRDGQADRALKTTYVAYRRTRRVIRGRQVYSLVTRD